MESSSVARAGICRRRQDAGLGDGCIVRNKAAHHVFYVVEEQPQTVYTYPAAPRDDEAAAMYAAVTADISAQRRRNSAGRGGLLGYDEFLQGHFSFSLK